VSDLPESTSFPGRAARDPAGGPARGPAAAPLGSGTAPGAVPLGARKREVRERLLRRRRELPAAARADLDARLLAGLVPLLAGVRSVAGYAPLRAEPGGPGLLDLLAARVPRVLLPVVAADNDLDWAVFDGGLTARPGGGLREPAGPRLGVAALSTVDLVLVPAVAVDRRGGVRLGRGGGSYDRALPRRRPGTPAIALLYPGELLDDLPSDPHDQHVDAVLTRDGLLVPGSQAPPAPV
jgi:5-formyltetrahydrofolate cyclo-ligase